MSARRNMKIKKLSATDQVFDAMWINISGNVWKPGEQIPSENDLADSFGVNRLTVRMALQKLNALGIIETRVGEGSYVCCTPPDDYFQSVSKFYMRPEMIDNVFEFRRTIELECARLAIERASAKEIEKLYSIDRRHTDFCDSVGTDLSDENIAYAAEIDYEFHYYLCSMAHNPLFTYAYSLARESILQYLKMLLHQRWKHKETLRHSYGDTGHLLICNAIRDKNQLACQRFYFDMIDYTQNPDYPNIV